MVTQKGAFWAVLPFSGHRCRILPITTGVRRTPNRLLCVRMVAEVRVTDNRKDSSPHSPGSLHLQHKISAAMSQYRSKPIQFRGFTGHGAIQKLRYRNRQPGFAVWRGSGPAYQSQVLTGTLGSSRTGLPSRPGTSLFRLEAHVYGSRASFLCLGPPINGGHSFRIFCTRSHTEA